METLFVVDIAEPRKLSEWGRRQHYLRYKPERQLHSYIYFQQAGASRAKFTPTLIQAYKKAKEEKKERFEVIYVSLDSEEEAFNSYRVGMPWPAVGFRDTRRALLQMGLGIKSIPALVVLDPRGSVITSSGVTEIATNKTLHDLFTSDMAVDLGESVETLQRHPVCIALCDALMRKPLRKP